MHRLLTMSCVFILMTALDAPAGATGLSMNEVALPSGATLDDCKATGRAALQQAGLRGMPESPASVFASSADNDLAAIYCLPQRGIAIAGPDNQSTRPILGKLVELWGRR